MISKERTVHDMYLLVCVQALPVDVLPKLHFQQHVGKSLSHLWRSGQLCDVQLHSSDSDQLLPVHRVMLAACSGFFRALFCGAGQSMREGASVDNNGNMVVQLPYSRQQVLEVMTMLYDYNVDVSCMTHLVN